MDKGANFHAAMESSVSKQTYMGYVPHAYGQDAYGAAIKREVATYAREGFVWKSQGFPLHHHQQQIDKNTYPHDVYLQDGVRKDG